MYDLRYSVIHSLQNRASFFLSAKYLKVNIFERTVQSQRKSKVQTKPEICQFNCKAHCSHTLRTILQEYSDNVSVMIQLVQANSPD